MWGGPRTSRTAHFWPRTRRHLLPPGRLGLGVAGVACAGRTSLACRRCMQASRGARPDARGPPARAAAAAYGERAAAARCVLHMQGNIPRRDGADACRRPLTPVTESHGHGIFKSHWNGFCFLFLVNMFTIYSCKFDEPNTTVNRNSERPAAVTDGRPRCTLDAIPVHGSGPAASFRWTKTTGMNHDQNMHRRVLAFWVGFVNDTVQTRYLTTTTRSAAAAADAGAAV